MLQDLTFLAGLLLCTVGAWLISVPLGLIATGAALLAFWWFLPEADG